MWTTANTERLLRYHRAGYSASRIGAKLGTTKSAILGRLYRLGMSERGKDAHWSPRRRAKFIRLWMAALPVRLIARQMSMTCASVYWRRRAMMLPGRRELANRS